VHGRDADQCSRGTVERPWAYAGFTIVLISALIAHLSVGDGPEAWSWSVGFLVLGALSYVSFRMTAPA